jgi:hypothetical protein
VFHLLKQEWALLVPQSLLVLPAQDLVSLAAAVVVWQQVSLVLVLVSVLLVVGVVLWQQVLLALALVLVLVLVLLVAEEVAW